MCIRDRNPVYFCLIFSVIFIFLEFFRSVQYNVAGWNNRFIIYTVSYTHLKLHLGSMKLGNSVDIRLEATELPKIEPYAVVELEEPVLSLIHI